ncbi:unnamed protein product [Pieris macdunnoughi]|uniref:Uncharacterized protein n=1 Tax=Pieris macdunnoughi TaxID=345717 RepID=A0A821R2R9_9NEOP|nr:unnamed protein product [Pieris macdunnoughi]
MISPIYLTRLQTGMRLHLIVTSVTDTVHCEGLQSTGLLQFYVYSSRTQNIVWIQCAARVSSVRPRMEYRFHVNVARDVGSSASVYRIDDKNVLTRTRPIPVVRSSALGSIKIPSDSSRVLRP